MENTNLIYRKISAFLSLWQTFLSFPSATFIFRELTLLAYASCVLLTDTDAFHAADTFLCICLFRLFYRDRTCRTGFCTGAAECAHTGICFREKCIFSVFFVRCAAGHLKVDVVEGFFLSDPAVEVDTEFSDCLQICFIRPSRANRRYDGVLCRECSSADDFKAAAFHFGLEFKEGGYSEGIP